MTCELTDTEMAQISNPIGTLLAIHDITSVSFRVEFSDPEFSHLNKIKTKTIFEYWKPFILLPKTELK